MDAVRRALRAAAPIVALAVLTVATAVAGDTARPAPTFSLKGTHDTTVCLDSLRGKVVLLDFWASWCEPCQKSFPWLDQVQKRYRSQGVVVVAINLDRTREPAEAFLERHPAAITIAFDPAGRVAEAYHVNGMPSTFLIGRDGTVLHSHVGFDPRKAATLEALLATASAR